MTALPILKPRKCAHCKYEWYPRKNAGKICPQCKRPYFPVSRTRKTEA